MARTPLPTGTVTFLFTDIAGSTHLLQQLGAARYAEALTTHRRLLRAAFERYHGREVDTQGDAFFVAFASAPAALAAAAEAQHALASAEWPENRPVQVRMGLHTGTPKLAGDQYVGLDVHRAARIATAGHGGQILLSQTTHDLAEHDLPEGATLRALGEHHLKDLQQPEAIFQLVLPGLPADFPTLKTLGRHAHNLPIQPTPLLGREREVNTICALLRRHDVRLVTLTGPGGVGKTRLGLQVAAELVEAFPDGVWFVQLSRLSDPALVAPSIAQTLGLREVGARPLDEALRESVRTRTLLLMLDNFEQVAAAASVVAMLLAASAGLKVLATSRVPLRLRGEKVMPVAPLGLPPIPSTERAAAALDHVTQSPAVALFVQRAQDVRPEFRVTPATVASVAAICAQVDGLPLALELAAAKLKVLSPAQLLTRLERQLSTLTGGALDLEERQQTLRHTLTWSYDLLSTQEQCLFRRLAVFAGGCTLEAAEAVCAAPKSAEPLLVDVLDALAALVDQNLVRQRAEGEEGGASRFSLLHVVREFALEQVEASGESEALRRAHADFYLALAEQAEPGLEGTMAAGWLTRLERDIDNLRAALTWAHERRDVALGLQLTCAWSEVWYMRGSLREGRQWAEEFLALGAVSATDEESAVPNRLQARSLHWAAFFAYWQGDYDAAKRQWLTSLALARREGDTPLAVQALKRLATIASYQGEPKQADAYYEESLALANAHGDTKVMASALANWGTYAYFRGEYTEAVARIERALQLRRDVGGSDSYVTAVWLDTLARAAVRQGDLARATALECDALALWRDVGALARLPEALEVFAMRDGAAGEGQRAARLLGAAETLRQAVGSPLSPEMRTDIEALMTPVKAALGEQAWQASYVAGGKVSLEEAIAEALGENGEEGTDA